MPSKITNSGLVTTYNGRGLICHNANTSPLVQLSDGTLFAAIREFKVTEPISLFRSTDNGFSWKRVWKGDMASQDRKVAWANITTNGPVMYLSAFEEYNKLILWHSYGNTTTGKYDVEPFVFYLDDPTERIVDEAYLPQMQLDVDQMMFDVAYNQSIAFVVYVSYSQLRVHMTAPSATSTFEAKEQSGDFFNLVSATCDDAGNVDILILANGDPYKVQHFRYRQVAEDFEGPHHIANLPGQTDATDLDLVRDGYGTLFATWSEQTEDGTDARARYSMSTDEGSTWSVAETVPREPGHTVFVDRPTGFKTARTTALAGVSGFILSYVTQNEEEERARTFVREFTTTDGETYEMGPSRTIGSQAATHEDVPGLRFFKPPQPKLLDISTPGHVRIAYQIGQGNRTSMTDTVPVRIGQELLSESAFPTILMSESKTYEIDSELEGEIVATINILGGPSERHDYYALGMVSTVTSRYISAFDKVGIECRFLKYEPTAFSTLNDRSAYGSPQEFTSKITIDPKTYTYPLAGRGGETQHEYIERDIRVVHIPPHFHLGRTHLVNRGGYLKRTVWTVEFDGNSYELTQIVPYFVDGVIAYYTANAYVVGPSHDPFSRPVLSSET